MSVSGVLMSGAFGKAPPMSPPKLEEASISMAAAAFDPLPQDLPLGLNQLLLIPDSTGDPLKKPTPMDEVEMPVSTIKSSGNAIASAKTQIFVEVCVRRFMSLIAR